MLPAVTAPTWTAESRRQYIRYNIPYELWIEKGRTWLYEQTRGTILGIRKQDFLEIGRDVIARIERGERFSDVPKDQLSPRGRMYETDWDLSRKLLYKLDILTWDPDEEEFVTLSRSFASDHQLTQQEVEDEAWKRWSLETGSEPLDFINALMVDVWIKPGAILARR